MSIKLTVFIGALGSALLAPDAIPATCERLRSVSIPNVAITTAELVPA